MFLFLSGAAWGSASLYRGAELVGTVATTDGPGLWVSLEETGALLGFASSRTNDELALTREGTRIRVVRNAAAAWDDRSLVPLYSAPVEENGRWWADTASAAALFQKSVGPGTQNKLRFAGASGAPSSTLPAPSQPQPRSRPSSFSASSSPSPSPSPSPPLTSSSPSSSSPSSLLSSSKSGQAAPLAAASGSAKSSAASPRQQAKYETFDPKARTQPPSHPSLNGGEIRRLRWSTSGLKIRAVVDASDGADPQVQMKDGAIHAFFAKAVASPEGLPAPYENVKAEIKNQSGGVELVFTSNSVRVEKMVLDSPRRIVFDFFFAQGTRIRDAVNAQPRKTQTAPATPAAQTQTKRKGRRVVVIDPGHGGRDPGAAANNVREKNVNLAVGLALEKALKARGIDVIMTRRTDVYLKLQDRTDIANRAKADLFVSVHVNALPSAKRTSGFEIYIMALPTDRDALNLAKIENREYVEGKTGSTEAMDSRTELLLRILGDMQQNNKINESTGLAEALFRAGKQNGLPMKRVAQAPFFVLRGAGMPAVLLEIGFVTNATEAKLLAHSGYQQRIAQAMAAGIDNYLK